MQPLAGFLLLLLSSVAAGQGPSLLDLQKLPFFHGREYFVLRSGRTQMIVQADRADLGPAFTYLLFDAQDARQSARKESALNFDPADGWTASGAVVELGGTPFSALGHRTHTQWVSLDGVPAVQAVWWAGGIRVTEHLRALAGDGVFSRSVRLEGAHLIGPEPATLWLSLPPGPVRAKDALLVRDGDKARLAIAAAANAPIQADPARGALKIGPLSVAPGESVEVRSLLFAEIPPADSAAFEQRASAVAARSAADELASTRQRWARASVVSTSDNVVREIFDKARFGLPGMIAEDGTMDAGIFEYGAQWVRDTSNTVLGAIHTGEFELARATLERVLTKMISSEGVTMIANSFDTPDKEQFDQMGELLHVLKAYRDWTGDDALVRAHRELLLAAIERPLQAQFRDDTGMVHNRREFWERTFDDAYELAYQTYVIQGLRDAADLAGALDAADRTDRWRSEADRMLRGALSHPSKALVRDGRLIKRRNVTGEVADLLTGYRGFAPDTPGSSESHHRLLPDASAALPIALGIVDARSDLARKTLDDLEALWNTRWSDGGYDRYHTSSQPDQPGPWPFATCFILRAQHDAGLFDRSRRSLEWLNSVPGGRAGAWFEEIPSARSTQRACGIVPWTSAELALFVVRHYLGVRFVGDTVALKPALYAGSPPVSADLRFRGGRLKIGIDGPGSILEAVVNGSTLKPGADGAIRLPPDFAGGTVVIRAAK